MPPAGAHPARYWKMLDGGRIECELCPRACRLADGQQGLCFVRERRGEEIVLTTYGRSSGFCVDPIEKKPLYHFLPGTPILSFGTAGCNLICNFCQNWDLSRSRQTDRLADAASPETIARAAQRLNCRCVAYTYNDPIIFLEYAVDTAQACREAGVRSVAVTAGYINDKPREEFFRFMDAANVDLKAFTEDFYKRNCGAHLQPVLDTLTYLARETKVWLEITTLLIPGENDSEKEIEQLTQWVEANLGPDVPVHFSAFHPDYKMLDRDFTPISTLRTARRIAKKNGVRHVYTGNVHDVEGGSTYCAKCGALLIGRDGYELQTWKLDAEAKCAACGERCAGVFDASPGRWGSRRLPVRLRDFE